MATLRLTIENGITSVEGSIPSIFRLVNSIPEIQERNQVYFRGEELKKLLKEEGRYRILKVGETPEHEKICRLSDSLEKWEIEYEIVKIAEYGNYEICIVRNMLYNGQMLYKIGSDSDCKTILDLEF